MKPHESPFINKRKKLIEFYIRNNHAHHITLSGNFNNWAHDVLQMQQDKEGMWRVTIPMLPTGKYKYKFFIDDKQWMEDIDNPLREPDGLTGFNSVLVIN